MVNIQRKKYLEIGCENYNNHSRLYNEVKILAHDLSILLNKQIINEFGRITKHPKFRYKKAYYRLNGNALSELLQKCILCLDEFYHQVGCKNGLMISIDLIPGTFLVFVRIDLDLITFNEVIFEQALFDFKCVLRDFKIDYLLDSQIRSDRRSLLSRNYFYIKPILDRYACSSVFMLSKDGLNYLAQRCDDIPNEELRAEMLSLYYIMLNRQQEYDALKSDGFSVDIDNEKCEMDESNHNIPPSVAVLMLDFRLTLTELNIYDERSLAKALFHVDSLYDKVLERFDFVSGEYMKLDDVFYNCNDIFGDLLYSNSETTVVNLVYSFERLVMISDFYLNKIKDFIMGGFIFGLEDTKINVSDSIFIIENIIKGSYGLIHIFNTYPLDNNRMVGFVDKFINVASRIIMYINDLFAKSIKSFEQIDLSKYKKLRSLYIYESINHNRNEYKNYLKSPSNFYEKAMSRALNLSMDQVGDYMLTDSTKIVDGHGDRFYLIREQILNKLVNKHFKGKCYKVSLNIKPFIDGSLNVMSSITRDWVFKSKAIASLSYDLFDKSSLEVIRLNPWLKDREASLRKRWYIVEEAVPSYREFFFESIIRFAQEFENLSGVEIKTWLDLESPIVYIRDLCLESPADMLPAVPYDSYFNQDNYDSEQIWLDSSDSSEIGEEGVYIYQTSTAGLQSKIFKNSVEDSVNGVKPLTCPDLSVWNSDGYKFNPDKFLDARVSSKFGQFRNK